MDTTLLQALGLTVREEDGRIEAELELASRQFVNPLTRKRINRVTFTLHGDLLVAIAPPELVGCAPVFAHVGHSQHIEAQLAHAFNQHVFQLSRRSAELAALGIPSRVDPESVELSGEVVTEGFRFLITADKQGNFRVARAQRGETELTIAGVQTFELSEFRERRALEGYLLALFGGAAQGAALEPGMLVTFGDVVTCFGASAVVPAKSSLEILVELRLAGLPYRFAAARIAGRAFRGLLAGSAGRVWAGRFELDEFPGVRGFVANLFKVTAEEVEIVGPGGG